MAFHTGLLPHVRELIRLDFKQKFQPGTEDTSGTEFFSLPSLSTAQILMYTYRNEGLGEHWIKCQDSQTDLIGF